VLSSLFHILFFSYSFVFDQSSGICFVSKAEIVRFNFIVHLISAH